MQKKAHATIINLTAVVFKNDNGYFARAVELPLVSDPARTKAKAIQKLTATVHVFLARQADQGTLLTTLDEDGFTGAIDSSVIEARVYDEKVISAPLPPGSLRKKAARHQTGAGESHAQ